MNTRDKFFDLCRTAKGATNRFLLVADEKFEFFEAIPAFVFIDWHTGSPASSSK
jgi:hypothetical protein